MFLHIKKKLAAILAVAMLLVSFTATALAYVGNSNSMKFHDDDCRWAKKISSEHRVEFEDRDEAIAEGYVPCKVCRP